MIQLPPDWQKYSVSYVVGRLLDEAEAIGQYAQAARAMVRGSLEFMLAGPPLADRQLSLVPHELGWRLKDWLFIVLPRVNDDVLLSLKKIRLHKLDADLLAPPWAEQVARYSVKAILPRSHVEVYSIDRYIDLRMLWTRIDKNQGQTAALIDLLDRYGRLVETMPEIWIQR